MDLKLELKMQNKTMEIKRKIEVSDENRNFLAKAFKVTKNMVWYALNFDHKRGNSDLAKRIRNLALQRGGVLVSIAPACETIHSAGGYMRQYFPNDVKIEVHTAGNGKVCVYKRDELVATYDNPSLTEFESIQREAMAL